MIHCWLTHYPGETADCGMQGQPTSRHPPQVSSSGTAEEDAGCSGRDAEWASQAYPPDGLRIVSRRSSRSGTLPDGMERDA